MHLAGINNFNMASLEHIPKAQVTVPKIEKKEPTVHNSSIPYPFHKPSLDHAMKSRERMQAMFQEMLNHWSLRIIPFTMSMERSQN